MLAPMVSSAQEQRGPFQRLDANQDGKLMKGELPKNRQAAFTKMDTSGDMSVSPEELLSYLMDSRAAADQPAVRAPTPTKPAHDLPPAGENVTKELASDTPQITVPIVSTETSPIEEILISQTSYGVVRKPPGPGPFPAVIFLHGGLEQSPMKRLRSDTKNLPVQNRFLAWGYVVVNATRRAITHDPLDRGVVDDTLAMIEAIKAIPGVAPNSVVLYGGSGGGTLAIELAGVSDVAAVVAGEPATIIYMGMFNKDHIIFDSEGKPTGDKRWDVMRANPKELYTPKLRQRTRDKLAKIRCPVLVLHGDQHALKTFNLDLFVPEMNAMQIDVETIIYPGEKHGFYWGRGDDSTLPLKSNCDADAFFRMHISTQPKAIDPKLINDTPISAGRTGR